MQYQNPSNSPSALRMGSFCWKAGRESRGRHYLIIAIASTSFLVLDERIDGRAGGARMIIWGCTVLVPRRFGR